MCFLMFSSYTPPLHSTHAIDRVIQGWWEVVPVLHTYSGISLLHLWFGGSVTCGLTTCLLGHFVGLSCGKLRSSIIYKQTQLLKDVSVQEISHANDVCVQCGQTSSSQYPCGARSTPLILDMSHFFYICHFCMKVWCPFIFVQQHVSLFLQSTSGHVIVKV